MEQVRVSPRRKRQGVHIEEERVKPIFLPTVITRNESGQEMETSIVIYPWINANNWKIFNIYSR